VLVEDQLFATLDPTTRSCTLPSNRAVLFTDTVGFIQKLPTQLIAAFRATLEEVSEADLLVHVVDVTHPHAMTQIEAVNQTLLELDVAGIPQVLALNKVDRLPQDTILELETVAEHSVPISAMTGQGLDQLKMRVETMLYESLVAVQVVLPHSSGGLLANFHERGSVAKVQHRTEGIYVKGFLPGRLIAEYRDFLVTSSEVNEDQDAGQEPN
jgi:GTP-binding protein HflX